MQVQSKSCFMYTSIKSHFIRMARSIAVLSLFGRGLQLSSFIVFFLCQRLGAAASHDKLQAGSAMLPGKAYKNIAY
jgi:hypothetical protein